VRGEHYNLAGIGLRLYLDSWKPALDSRRNASRLVHPSDLCRSNIGPFPPAAGVRVSEYLLYVLYFVLGGDDLVLLGIHGTRCRNRTRMNRPVPKGTGGKDQKKKEDRE
jgi:hypothetical protein